MLCGDNAATIKSRYIVAWAYEKVEEGVFDEVELRFLVPGHTKFSPDQLFATVSANLAKVDVFSFQDIEAAVRRSDIECVHFTSEDIQQWRSYLDRGHKEVRGIRDMRCIRVFKQEDEIAVEGAPSNAEGTAFTRLHTRKTGPPVDPAALRPDVPFGIDGNKLKDLRHMFDTYVIDTARFPFWLREPDVIVRSSKRARLQ